MTYIIPVVADFKDQFDRDFPFCTLDQTDTSRIRDKDITKALVQAGINFSQANWSSQANFTYAYCLLAAHYLCENIAASSQGINGQGEWLINAKSVDTISANFSIPERIMKSIILAPISKTTYGCAYLELLAPQLVGNVFPVCGFSKP
jgi:hypothetical protein